MSAKMKPRIIKFLKSDQWAVETACDLIVAASWHDALKVALNQGGNFNDVSELMDKTECFVCYGTGKTCKGCGMPSNDCDGTTELCDLHYGSLFFVECYRCNGMGMVRPREEDMERTFGLLESVATWCRNLRNERVM